MCAYRDSIKPFAELSYWRSERGFEVDFIYDNRFAIEIKSSRSVTQKDLAGLISLEDEGLELKKIIVCREPARKTIANGIEIYPWKETGYPRHSGLPGYALFKVDGRNTERLDSGKWAPNF